MKRNNVKITERCFSMMARVRFPMITAIRVLFDRHLIKIWTSCHSYQYFFRKNVNYKHYTSSFISNTSCYFDRNSDLSHGR